MIDKTRKTGGSQVQGEGDYEAAREYNSDTRKLVEAGKVPDAAKSARKELDTDEAKELDEAEKEGQKPARK